MSAFEWIRDYDPAFDLRDWTSLARKVQKLPRGLFRPVLGARRSGKTWALHAVKAQIGAQARVLDLGISPELPTDIGDATILLLDEPGAHLFQYRDPADVRRHGRTPDPAAISRFFTWCQRLRDREVMLTMALTPAEWDALLAAGERYRLVDRNDLESGRLRPLTPEQARRIACTDTAQALFDQLPGLWIRSPFLLGLVLHVALDDPGGFTLPLEPEQLDELLALAIEKSRSRQYDYDYYVLYEGLTLQQRDIVRAVCRGAHMSKDDKDDCRSLEGLGLIRKAGDGYEPGDPVLASILPPPLRIHHVSDLHFGAKSAERIDAKDKGLVGRTLSAGAGQGLVVDDYHDWLDAQKPSARPHLLIVSGDIAEWAQPDELEAGKAWLYTIEAKLSRHSDLLEKDPRVLLVPGNHDVDWSAPASADGERLRHLPFARVFGDTWPRPALEQPPGKRPVAHYHFTEADLSVLLLGSCEYGGQRDVAVERVTDEAKTYAEADGNLDLAELAKETRGSYGRHDPGLVHDADIQAARRHTWRGQVRVAVLHHPLSPIPASTEIAPYAGLVNAGQLKGVLLEQGFCLALHGHVHSPWVATEQWHGRGAALLICSTRTLGSHETQHGHGFNEVRILREGEEFEVEVQPFVRRDRAFVPDGEPVRIQVRIQV